MGGVTGAAKLRYGGRRGDAEVRGGFEAGVIMLCCDLSAGCVVMRGELWRM